MLFQKKKEEERRNYFQIDMIDYFRAKIEHFLNSKYLLQEIRF